LFEWKSLDVRQLEQSKWWGTHKGVQSTVKKKTVKKRGSDARFGSTA